MFTHDVKETRHSQCVSCSHRHAEPLGKKNTWVSERKQHSSIFKEAVRGLSIMMGIPERQQLERHLRAKQGFDGNRYDVWHVSCPLPWDTKTTAYKVKAAWRVDRIHVRCKSHDSNTSCKCWSTVLKTTWYIGGKLSRGMKGTFIMYCLGCER